MHSLNQAIHQRGERCDSSLKSYSFIIPVPEEKTAETERKCETENCVPEMVAEAGELPLSNFAHDQTLGQTQEGTNQEISAKGQENPSQCSLDRTHSRRGRPPKMSLLCPLKKTSVKKENGCPTPQASGLQDSVSNADYTSSKYLSMQRSYNG